MQTAIKILRHHQAYGDSLLADIAPEDFCMQPAGPSSTVTLNHPAWIVGHMAFAIDRHATFLGSQQQLAEWAELFGKGSQLSTSPADYPSKDDLVTAWHAANGRMIAAVETADDAVLNGPNTGPLQNQYDTLGEFLAYSMTGHTATHLGQLSAWRRAMGREAMF